MSGSVEPPSDIELDRHAEPEPRPGRRVLWYALVAVAVAALVATGLFLYRGDAPDEPDDAAAEPAPDPPPTGSYAIRSVHSGLCLGIGPEIKDGDVNEAKEVFVQQDCARRFPPTGLRAQDNGLYQLTVDHPEKGPGCGRVDGPDRAEPGEFLVTPTECGDGERQYFLLEREAEGYLIRMSTDPEQCLGILEGSRKPKTQVVTGACGKPAQHWSIELP